MNRTALKNYAPQARRDFIQAMTDRAAFYGINAKKVEPMTVKGDVVVIGGREYSKAIADKRTRLEERIQRDGFNQTVDAVAYSWFNRFVALRYMELHGYLEHGYRVLSHPEGKPFPEILEHAEHLDLPTLDKNTVIDLKLAGNKENELYRLILLAQCNALHASMPFLFEEINDETELLLPEGLLNSDSLIRKLVDGIAEEDWQQVEIIGWLYQYYISEKKDEVIGSVVASEDIPAATQLFTPNWIVRYLVQNTLGRKWLATYPESSIRGQMEFYIEPAEQEPEVQAKLKEITPENLNPEEITFLDPACGSGHILVEAYDLFKVIYQEHGYRTKDIPSLILQKNLFGFEIDDRAAQLAMFALLMKARADDRRILDSKVQPNIVCFVESKGLNPADLAIAINQDTTGIGSGNVTQFDIGELVELFAHAKTIGSLIQVPISLAGKLEGIEGKLSLIERDNGFSRWSLKQFPALVKQARNLISQYDVVVANPPYMGNKYLNPLLRDFLKENFIGFEKDIYSSAIKRFCDFSKTIGKIGFVTPFNWMFINSFEDMRKWLINKKTIASLIQLEINAFEPAMVSVCTFTIDNFLIESYKASFVKLTEFKGSENQPKKTLEAITNKDCTWFYESKPAYFREIPNNPIAYWISDKFRELFYKAAYIRDFAHSKQGLATGDNSRFIRSWHEVSITRIGFGFTDRKTAKNSQKKWFPHIKGGPCRRWYGNFDDVVNWENDGDEIRKFGLTDGKRIRSRPQNMDFYFQPCITWSDISSSRFSSRSVPYGFIFSTVGPALFSKDNTPLSGLLGYTNSNVFQAIVDVSLQGLHYNNGVIGAAPYVPPKNLSFIDGIEKKLIELTKSDWDDSEASFDFLINPIVSNKANLLVESFNKTENKNLERYAKVKFLEEENNKFFIESYGLQSEFSPAVPDDQITLRKSDRKSDIKDLISYFIGCVMGRYSLDKGGLIYAHSSNEGFDSNNYISFQADDDGIVPLLNREWGIPDDAAERFVQFISVTWPKENIEENLRFVADSIGDEPDASALDVIRNYFSTGFYKHHLQIYKRRPIYWLFSSGKQKAFQALVYLHRYNEGTLSRMRTEYVIPLQGKISGRIEQLEADKLKATSTSQRKKFQKEQDDLKKQQAELLVFDEKLKNYADQRIKLDLDDGVKVNYAKFGDLLAEVKAVTGGSDE
jgi:type II restriction/modification system DNA methylase subunit YeeA